MDDLRTDTGVSRRGLARAFLPLAVLAVLAGFLVWGLSRDPAVLPTQLLDRPMPTFEARTLEGDPVTHEALPGEPALLNVFGSWCTACLIEHPLLMELSARGDVRLVGLNWRDSDDKAGQWLDRHGDPYDLIITDPRSRLAIDLGVTGAPETFVLDASGTIRFKHTGPISEDDWEGTLAPLLQSLAQTP